jgi:hypothetical protein
MENNKNNNSVNVIALTGLIVTEPRFSGAETLYANFVLHQNRGNDNAHNLMCMARGYTAEKIRKEFEDINLENEEVHVTLAGYIQGDKGSPHQHCNSRAKVCVTKIEFT